MRYWTRPPEVGSLEEDFAIAAEVFEESRLFEYVSMIMYGMLVSQAKGHQGLDAIKKILGDAHAHFFGKSDKSVVSDEEKKEFLDVMEKFRVRINRDYFRQELGTEENVSSPRIYNAIPRGEVLE